MELLLQILLLAVGFLALIKGADFFVDGSSALAKNFKVPGVIIGLTVVAIGTSLPELVTSVVASRKGENGLAVGNVVGSNIFNLLFILGVSGTIHPITVNLASVTDLAVLVLVSIITMLFARTKNIGRVEGAVMLLIYAADVVFAVLIVNDKDFLTFPAHSCKDHSICEQSMSKI